MVWKLDNKSHASKREVKEAKFLKNEKVVVSSKPGLREEKGGERSLERKRRWRKRRKRRRKRRRERKKNTRKRKESKPEFNPAKVHNRH